jgi:hypothetical protein
METKITTKKLWITRMAQVLIAAAVLVTFTQAASAHDDEDEGYQPRVHDWHSGWHHDWHSGPHVGWHDGVHYDPYNGWHYGRHYGPHAGPHDDWHGGTHHGWYGGDHDD